MKKLCFIFLIVAYGVLGAQDYDFFEPTPWEEEIIDQMGAPITITDSNIPESDVVQTYNLHGGDVLTVFPKIPDPSEDPAWGQTQWEKEQPYRNKYKQPPYIDREARITSSFVYPPLNQNLQQTPPALEEKGAKHQHHYDVDPCNPKPICEVQPECDCECEDGHHRHRLGRGGQAEDENVPYRLKIGDKLSISIYGEPNTTRTVTVDSSGNIYYLYVDRIFVLGKTIDELRRELNEQLKVEFKYALVGVTAVNVGGEYYTILGEVMKPGQKKLRGRPTLLKALGAAGGFKRGLFRNETIEYADLTRAFLTRRGRYIPVDFEALVRGGDMSQNIEIQNGDYIFIPALMSKNIYILGEVNYPTMLTYMKSVSLVEAITEAGGVTFIASSRVIVLRGSLFCPTQYLVDFNRILRHCEPDFCLEPGDIVYVPPRRFTTARLILEAAITSFVSTLANIAGSNAYISLNPGAAFNAITPVNIVTPVIVP